MAGLTKLFREFVESEKAGGLLLISCTVVSLVLANSALSESYNAIWGFSFGNHTVAQWINDGLMAVFFLLIGLELKREIYVGGLKNLQHALLPVFAALGGILFPAGIHLLFNYGTPTQDGAGIPMATDIAFALAILSLAGKGVPSALKIFLTALAVIDDLGAIIVIAIFYSQSIAWIDLIVSLSVFGLLLVLNGLKVRNLILYLTGGVVMWYFMLSSGVHATIAGVLLALAVPFGDGGEKSPSHVLQHILHLPVAFIILPLFALANTNISVSVNWQQTMLSSNGLGIAAGLIIGKPLGILVFTYLSNATKLTTLPKELTFRMIMGAGFLGGIGFTMSIFITLLAFTERQMIDQSKIVVILSSVVAGIAGYLILRSADKQMTRYK